MKALVYDGLNRRVPVPPEKRFPITRMEINRKTQLILYVLVWLVGASTQVMADPAATIGTQIDPAVDKAIDRGLAYLANGQAKEGFFPSDWGKASGVVSLCGMAFLSKGHLPGRGQYGEVINRCIDYVLNEQVASGLFDKNHTQGKVMYSHNISTLFMCEVSGMVDPDRQNKIDQALPKAIKLILTAQQVNKSNDQKGGWRYQPNSSDSDLSCSGWACMALRSARLNGAPVPVQAIDDAVKYIMGKHNKNTGQFGYQDQVGYSITLTGAALLCLELTGHHGEEATYEAGNYILQVYRELPKQVDYCFYGNYYNAQAMFQLGGKYWEKYSSWMYAYWLPKQQADGSWVGELGSLPYTTAMMILAFTPPYRQLPIYQRDETVDEEE